MYGLLAEGGPRGHLGLQRPVLLHHPLVGTRAGGDPELVHDGEELVIVQDSVLIRVGRLEHLLHLLLRCLQSEYVADLQDLLEVDAPAAIFIDGIEERPELLRAYSRVGRHDVQDLLIAGLSALLAPPPVIKLHAQAPVQHEVAGPPPAHLGDAHRLPPAQVDVLDRQTDLAVDLRAGGLE